MPRTRRPSGALDITLNWGRGYSDSAPVAETLSFTALIRRFALPDTKRGKLPFAKYQALNKNIREQKKIAGNEKNGEYFIPATFKKPRVRTADQIDRIFGFVLDFDSGKTTQKVIEEKLCGLSYVGYTSYSHTPDVPRFRVLIPYCKPIAPEQHVAVFEHFYAMFGGDIDLHSKNAAQIWYTPACPPDAGNMFVSFSNFGKCFDALALASSAAKRGNAVLSVAHVPKVRTGVGAPASQVMPAPTGGSLSKLDVVRSALQFISPDDRHDWITVGMAIKRDLGVGGFALWQEWSKGSAKFDPDEALPTWESFKPRGAGEKVATLQTIYFKAKASGWVPPAPDDPPELKELNDKYFVGFDAGKTSVFKQDFDPVLKRDSLARMSFSDFTNLYSNKAAINGDGKPVPLGKLFLNHPNRPQYEGVIFAPGQDIPGYYNLWRGWAVEPKRGVWRLFRRHIRDVICAGNKEHAEYVINWMASAVQNPGRPAETAIAVQGARGAGKGRFVSWFGKLFGQHYVQVQSARHITGNFNAHLKDAVLLFLDEGFWAGDKSAESILKGLITEATRTHEGKYENAKSVGNFLHIMIASNEDWLVPAGLDERRFLVLKVSGKRRQNQAYFNAIEKEMKGGGLEAMLYDLQRRDLSKFNIRSVPRSEGLDEQKIHSMHPIDLWWFETLKKGELPHGAPVRDLPTWGIVPKFKLVNDFAEHAKSTHTRIRGTATAIGMRLRTLLPRGWPKSSRPTGSAVGVSQQPQVHCYEFPPLDLCRKHFETVSGLSGFDWNA